jgi:uncharacterized protein (TIGR02145 family)
MKIRLPFNFRIALLYVLLSSSVLLNPSCKKDKEEPETEEPDTTATAMEEGLTAEQNAMLETWNDTLIPLENLMVDSVNSALGIIQELDPLWLQNSGFAGRISDYSAFTEDQQRLLLLAKMLVVGNYLVDDSQHQYPDEGANKPSCNGLRYGFGSRLYQQRTQPVLPQNVNAGTTCAPDTGCIKDLIYGLDCSAMTYWIAYNAGLRFNNNHTGTPSGYFGDPTNWNSAFTNPGSDNYNKLRASIVQHTSPGSVPANQLQTGDVIVFGNPVFHVGIVLGSGTQKYIYQSNGTGYACPSNGNGCTNNNSQSRGPRMLELKQSELNQFSSNYKVIRIGAACPATILDNDGNEMLTVKIGNQCWCKENLKSSAYSNGDEIPEVTDNTTWASTSTEAFSHYDNDVNSALLFGKLYNYYTVNDPRNVCPDGWHVPTLNELTTLVNFLGGEEVAGGKLKGILSWTAPNVGADNSSGFSGQPGGARFETGVFGNQLDAGFWWTQTPGDGNGAWCLSLTNTAASAGISSANQQNGFSVRCIRD